MNKDNTCVIALVVFNENIKTNPMKVFRVLSFVVYSFIDNFVWIGYISCQSKILSVSYSDKISMDRSYIKLLCIIIPEVLMNLISCHGFIKDTNSTAILLCRNWLVEYYLPKGFLILEHKPKTE